MMVGLSKWNDKVQEEVGGSKQQLTIMYVQNYGTVRLLVIRVVQKSDFEEENREQHKLDV